MKFFFALSFLLIAGCSHQMNAVTPGPQSAIFQPGGQFYMEPGMFTGTWTITTTNDNNIIVRNEINPCTAVITEADSLLFGTISNDSTKEVLSLSGVHTGTTSIVLEPVPHLYLVQSASSLGDTNLTYINFFSYGDSLWSDGYEKVPATDSTPYYVINCVRKK
jgi:hypothetical protein